MNIMTRHIPDDWRLEKLGQLFEERKEKVSDKEFSPLSVTKQGIVPQMEHVAKSDDSDNRKRVAAGDFVINSRSDRRGSSGLSELDGSVSLINMVLKPRHGHPRFIHHLMRSYAFQEEFYRFGHGIVADLWTTRYSELKGITVAIPDEVTQKEIADFLDRETARIDQLIVRKKKLLKLIQEKFDAKLNALTNIGTQTRIKHLRVFLTSGSRGWGDYYSDYGNVFLRITNVTQPGIDVDFSDTAYVQLPKNTEGIRTKIQVGDILISITAELGAIAVANEQCSGAFVNQHLALLRLNQRRCDPRFVGYSLSSRHCQEQFRLSGYGGTKQGLSLTDVCEINFGLPDITKQIKVRENLDNYHNQCRKLKELVGQTIDGLQQFRTSLITEAVTGQLDIKAWKKKGGTDKRLDNIEEAMAS